MSDREKVIKEFEHLLNAAKGNYQDFVDLTVDGGEEILALLKEQEAVKPVPPEDEFSLYRCGKCHHQLFISVDKYCSRCGRPVKWNVSN